MIPVDPDDGRRWEDPSEGRRWLDFIMEATRTHFDIIDADLNLLFVDDAWRKIYGDPRGRKCYDYFMGREAPCPGCGVPEALETRQVVVTEEYLPREERDVEVHTIPFQDATGRWLVAEFNIDITDRKRAEQERVSLAEQLHHSQKMAAIGRLAGGIAHDFNNLLTVISGHCGFAARSLPEGHTARSDVECVMEAARRAADLTRQLLAFSRRQSIEPREIDLNEVVRGMESMLDRVLGEDIRLTADLAEDLGPVRADPGQLEQVIMNLAVNARDAMPSGGDLVIGTRAVEIDEQDAAGMEMVPGECALLSVRDTGLGMQSGILGHIFDPFFTTKEVGKGTGLGLSMVWGIVRQSGGHVRARSEPDRGATFEILLPMAGPGGSAAEDTTPGPGPVPRAEGSETVLVVEDERIVRELVEKVLRAAGYQVLSAAEGGEAERALAGHPGPVHLLLCDVVMPGMRGGELAAKLTAARPGMPVLLMSGYPDARGEGTEPPVPDASFIAKPFSAADLTRKVREVLDAGRLSPPA